MAEDKFSLHVDSDWKKQAQEEKRKLAEQEAQRKQAAPAPVAPAGAVAAPVAPGRGAGAAAGRQAGGRERQEPTFMLLVQSLLTQVLLYLGEIGMRGMEPMVDLDAAKQQLDLLGMLGEKTRGNLTAEEQKAYDMALYQAQMRFMRLAERFAELP